MTDIAASTWRRLKNRYNLVGKRCSNCNTVYFPPRMICSNCTPPHVNEDFQLSGVGKITSYTVVHVPPEEHSDVSPYILAVIETKEGPKLTSQIVECNEKDLYIDMPVEMVLRKITKTNDGLISYGYKFRPLFINLEN